jgi:hypothetical protein
MNRLHRTLTVAAGVASVGALAAFTQPERGPRLPDAREGKFYPKYHITQGEDGRRVYLWGFDPETGETALVASERAPDNWKDMGVKPGTYRDYYFASSADGKRLFVWGYNPGQGVLRLISGTTAEDAAIIATDRDRERKERESRERAIREREAKERDAARERDRRNREPD